MDKNRIKQIVSESFKKVIRGYEEYRIEDPEETIEYMYLEPELTGLHVDTFADDGGSYERHEHPLIFLARNGYSRNDTEFIPFLVSMEPRIIDPSIEYKISYNDIFDVQDFVQCNCTLLKALAYSEISQRDFCSYLKKPLYVVTEGKNLLNEMASYKMKDSNLPVDLWLDEGKTYLPHAPRVKFRANNEQRTTREYSSMLISDPQNIENFPQYSPLKKKDIDKIRRFVKTNQQLLLDLANGVINFRDDFMSNVILD